MGPSWQELGISLEGVFSEAGMVTSWRSPHVLHVPLAGLIQVPPLSWRKWQTMVDRGHEMQTHQVWRHGSVLSFSVKIPSHVTLKHVSETQCHSRGHMILASLGGWHHTLNVKYHHTAVVKSPSACGATRLWVWNG